MEYVLLLLGFVLLIKGADFFVDGCSSVAKLLRIPSIIIGLTVVAFGTSLPEASVSINAALKGENALALSNVIGSNLFNLLVVAGVSAVISPLVVRVSVLRKDFPISIFITAALLVMCIPVSKASMGKTSLGRVEGIILLAVFLGYLIWTVMEALQARKDGKNIQEEEEYKVLSPVKTAVFILGGIVAIKYGGDFVVNSASTIAATFGLSSHLIGLTIVALGTSLPELVTSIVAAKKGESDLALGNVVGSNIFNILLVLGMSAALHPIQVDMFSIYDMIILLVCSIIVYLFAWHRRTVEKKEGWMMLPLYVIFFVYIILR